MRPDIYIFNPDNDMALAKGGANYIAPAFAAQLTRDLEPLMAWVVPRDALLAVHDVAALRPWLDTLHDCHGLAVETISLDELPREGNFHPGGWSATLRRILIKRGVDAKCLPKEDVLACWRTLSHRRTSILFHEHMRREMSERFSPAPVELRTIDEVVTFASAHPDCYVKLPWSASGRGVWHVHDARGHDFLAWLGGGLSRYGSVLCEEGVERNLDFALEFQCHSHQTQVIGISLFNCDAHNQFSHAVVANDATLRRLIAAHYPRLNELEKALTRTVNAVIAPYYEGPLGVDLLLGLHNGEEVINPCVEVNLRMTMGMVTSQLGNRLMHGDRTATFKIGEANTAPPCSLPLTPILPGTRHTAWLEMLEINQKG